MCLYKSICACMNLYMLFTCNVVWYFCNMLCLILCVAYVQYYSFLPLMGMVKSVLCTSRGHYDCDVKVKHQTKNCKLTPHQAVSKIQAAHSKRSSPNFVVCDGAGLFFFHVNCLCWRHRATKSRCDLFLVVVLRRNTKGSTPIQK